MTPVVDSGRIVEELRTLTTFSDTAAPAITRVAFSPPDLGAREWIRTVCRGAGLTLREDAVGNLFARWEGLDPGAAAVATGSHIDAIPNSGQYDGTVGFLGGLEAIRCLRSAGFRPPRSIELVLFTSEEPTRFGIGCLGSRLLSGSLAPERASVLRDQEGHTLDDARLSCGFKGDLSNVRLSASAYRAFVELHIEQAPRLERYGTAIGIVSSIAAPASLRVSVVGQGGHAGAVLMTDRRDALLGAAEIALAVDRVARSTRSADSVATTGVCEVFPGAVNSIPSAVRRELDVRDTDLHRRDSMVRAIQAACSEIADQRGLQIATEIRNADAPTQCHPLVVEAIRRACETAKLSHVDLVSRAYHHSLFMSRIAPTGMIFIPCRNGVSHHPDEYASPADIASGVLVLAHTLAQLAET